MKVTDLNKDRSIGSNSLLVELGPFKFLVDAGMNPKENGLDSLPNFSLVENFSLDFIILTHAHLDHLGALPVIAKRQSQADILTSYPTMVLSSRMLRNSVNIMRKQCEEGLISEPLFDKEDIEYVEEQILALKPNVTKVYEKDGEHLEVTFYPAGHVAGAIGFKVVYNHRKIFFTGDVLFRDQLTLGKANFPKEEFDTVVIETTRCATQTPADPTRESEVEALIDTISKTLSHGGSCLIPVFALGRMQEMLAILHDAIHSKRLGKVPIYCSGLGLDLVDYIDSITRKTGWTQFRRKILKDLRVKKYEAYGKHSKKMPEEGIYLISSGMMTEKTPSYIAASKLLGSSTNSVCFVGYCDPDTPGGKLLASHQGDTFIFEDLSKSVEIKAQVKRFDLSGHADREDLLKFVMECNPRAVMLTHGDEDARNWMSDSLMDSPLNCKVIDPLPGECTLI